MTVPSSCLIDVEPDLPRRRVLRMLHLRDDPHGAGKAGAAERRRDPDASAPDPGCARSRREACDGQRGDGQTATAAASGTDCDEHARSELADGLTRTKPARSRSSTKYAAQAASSSSGVSSGGSPRYSASEMTWLIRSRGWQPRS